MINQFVAPFQIQGDVKLHTLLAHSGNLLFLHTLDLVWVPGSAPWRHFQLHNAEGIKPEHTEEPWSTSRAPNLHFSPSMGYPSGTLFRYFLRLFAEMYLFENLAPMQAGARFWRPGVTDELLEPCWKQDQKQHASEVIMRGGAGGGRGGPRGNLRAD